MFCFQEKKMTQVAWDNPKWNTNQITWDGESINNKSGLNLLEN